MIAARTVGGLVRPDAIEEMERDLTKVIEDFHHAVNVEALRRIKKTGEHLFLAMAHSQLLRIDEELLLGRLKSVETNYHQDFRCIAGTREFLLKQVIGWATKESGKAESNTYWIYGMPGIGKTWLSHSICASLDEGDHLAGAFFCRRDDKSLSDPRNILPTLIHKLARMFPPFRPPQSIKIGAIQAQKFIVNLPPEGGPVPSGSRPRQDAPSTSLSSSQIKAVPHAQHSHRTFCVGWISNDLNVYTLDFFNNFIT